MTGPQPTGEATQENHMNTTDTPFFSIIIPTRNRARLFSAALDSVLKQDCDALEVIVVNDGSTGEELAAYRELEAAYSARHGAKITFEYLVHRPNGHGQSYSMNYGASRARGRYLGFLDDDDFWIADDHLSVCRSVIEAQAGALDLYYTNQTALFPDGSSNETPTWLQGLERLLDQAPDAFGAYPVRVTDLLRAPGFAHLNCTIVRRDLYEAIGGMDENIRYECDRDIYIRCIDAAQAIRFNPKFVSEHHIPDVKKSSNMSTAITIYQKKLFQLTVFDKAILQSRHRDIVRWARRAKSYELKKISRTLDSNGNHEDALHYAVEALASGFSIKWLGFVVMCAIKRLAGGRPTTVLP
jgi:glycosyltransferase involved in cell wall biosynthesis